MRHLQEIIDGTGVLYPQATRRKLRTRPTSLFLIQSMNPLHGRVDTRFVDQHIPHFLRSDPAIKGLFARST